MIIVVGHVNTSPENFDRLLQLSIEHVERSRKEPGCISHNVSIDGQVPQQLNFFEEWEDMPALKQHFVVAGSIQFAEQLRELATSPPELRFFEATQTR